MADPVLAGVIRVQAILQGISMLPEDRYVTTWAFSSDVADSDAGKAAAIERVRNFYTSTTAFGGTVASTLSGSTIAEAASELRAYNLGDPVGQREPYIEAFGLPTLSTAQAMPSEMAVCLSYYAEFNRPRLRGRVYIGPHTIGAIGGTGSTPAIVYAGVVGNVAAAADELASQTGFPRWVLISKQEGSETKTAKVITAGWVDNAWDVVRKRGEVATERSVWAAGA